MIHRTFLSWFFWRKHPTTASSSVTTYTRNVGDIHSTINLLTKIFIFQTKQIFINIFVPHIHLLFLTFLGTHILFHFFSNMFQTFSTLFSISISTNKMFVSIYASFGYFITKNAYDGVQIFFINQTSILPSGILITTQKVLFHSL